MVDQRPARGPTSTRVSVEAWSGGPATYAHAPAPAKAVEIVAQGADDREMRALRELLDAFPGFTLNDIALAYTDADSDVNAAAVLLTTRQPTVKCKGGKDVRRNSIAEKKNHGVRMSAEQSVVGSDELLLEKYGRGVEEIINRDSSKQSNRLFHSMQSAHDGASSCLRHLNSPTRHGVRWDNGSWGGEVMSKERSNGVSGDSALLLGRKKKKQKSWGGPENGVDQADTTPSREAAENLLLSMLGETFQLGVVRDVLDNFNGDTQKSAEVLLQMASSISPQAHKVNSTNTQDGWYFDDREKDGRVNSSHQMSKSFADNASIHNSMEFQKFYDDFGNGPNMVLKAGSPANSCTHQKSKTDQNHSKLKHSMSELKAIFSHIDDSYLFEVLQSNNFVLRDAVQFLLDATAHKYLTNSPAGSKVDQGKWSNILKTNVHKDSGDSLVTARSAPLRALWADAKPKIVPLKQNSPDVSLKRGLPEKTPKGKNGMPQFKSHGNVGEYGRQRHCAHEHWRMMDYYFKEGPSSKTMGRLLGRRSEAAAAYDRGERCRAVTLTEKGKEQKQLAQQADELASQRTLTAQLKSKNIVNNITIDLHAQHVGEAIKVLKRHLETLCSIPSVHMLTVFTGYGSHSINGRAKIKPAVTAFLSRNRTPWEEVNEGCLTIKLMDVRNKELDSSE